MIIVVLRVLFILVKLSKIVMNFYGEGYEAWFISWEMLECGFGLEVLMWGVFWWVFFFWGGGRNYLRGDIGTFGLVWDSCYLHTNKHKYM